MDTIKRQRRFTNQVPEIRHVWDSAKGEWVRYVAFVDSYLLTQQALRALKNKSKKAVRGAIKVLLISES